MIITGLKLINPIATEPITLAEVKQHLRLDLKDASEDDQLNSWITSAREHGESYTRRAFGTQTWELVLDNFPCKDYIEIPKPPLQSITSIIYKDSGGTERTFTDYIVDIDSEPGKVVLAYGKHWPIFTPYPVNAVRIRFVCGYNGSVVIPTCFKNAMLFHVGLFYKYRDEAIPKDHIDTVNRIYYPNRVFTF